MNKAILVLICFLSPFVSHGQEPTPPTQEWCEWAFKQIPDHTLLSEVDSAAFSTDFYGLLKEVEELSFWEEEVCECRTDGNDLIYYWYDILFEESYFDKETTTVSFRYTSITPETGEVLITIHHPDIFAPGSTDEYSRHTMYLLFESGAWRIDEWDNRRDGFREYIEYASRLKYLLR